MMFNYAPLKKPPFTNVNTLTLKNNDKNGSDKRLIAKKIRSTFKTQVIGRRQFQGIKIINNINNDLFIFCALRFIQLLTCYVCSAEEKELKFAPQHVHYF